MCHIQPVLFSSGSKLISAKGVSEWGRKRHRLIAEACSEKIAKLIPSSLRLAPRGVEKPLSCFRV